MRNIDTVVVSDKEEDSAPGKPSSPQHGKKSSLDKRRQNAMMTSEIQIGTHNKGILLLVVVVTVL